MIAIALVVLTTEVMTKKSYKYKKQFHDHDWVGNYSKLETCLREDAIYHELSAESFSTENTTCRYK